MNARRGKAGITLIELVIVLAVFAIFTAGISVIPAERRQVNAAAERLVNDIRHCQRLAMSEGKQTRILINASDMSYTLQQWESVRFVTLNRVDFGDYIESVVTNASGMSVEFTPRGTTGDACTITLSSKNYTAVMTVNVGAGRVRINEIIRRTGR